MYKNILLLNGSTRIKGNSLNICKSLKRLILDKGLDAEIENIQEYFNTNNVEDIRDKIINSDVIGLVVPLYVDALPYPVITFLEELESKFSEILKGKVFFVVGQCNFPESRRITPIILSSKCFAKKVEMKWLGGMGYGGAVIRIEGKTLEEAGKEGQRMINALDIAIEDVINGKEISHKAKNLLKNDINRFLIRPFTFMANMYFKSQRKRVSK